MKRLLAISWAMPPAVYPRSLQVSRSLKALASKNWDITVVCAEPHATATVDPALEARYRGAYRVLKIPQGNHKQSLWQRLRGRPIDDDAIWIENAASAAIRISRESHFDVVATFAQPWSDHLVGLRLRKATGLPWLAHFSDPWADNPYLVMSDSQRNLALSEESRVISTADSVVFTNSQTVDLVMKKYPPDFSNKVSIVPHGYEIQSFETKDNADRMLIVHMGDLYGRRSPASFFEGLGLLAARQDIKDRLEVVFVGSVTEECRESARHAGVDSFVTFCGKLKPQDATAIAARADLLLVIDAPSDSSPFLPSKLIDYLAFDRPIFGITPANGASADLLKSLGCKIASPDDVPAVLENLQSYYEDWQNKVLKNAESFKNVAKSYQIENTTGALEAALYKAINRAQLA